VARLASDLTLEAYTFLGSSGPDVAASVVVRGSHLYVGGQAGGSWGSPLRPYTFRADGFVERLDTDLNAQWNSFLGGHGNDSFCTGQQYCTFQLAVPADESSAVVAGETTPIGGQTLLEALWGDGDCANCPLDQFDGSFPSLVGYVAKVPFNEIQIPKLTVTVSGQSTNPTPVPEGPAGVFSYTARFCNKDTSPTLTSLFTRTRVLTNGNSLINRDRDGPGTPPGGVGSDLDFPLDPAYDDFLLDPGECVDVRYEIGLAVRRRFQFNVDTFGSVVTAP
jgi:hypothetical protein